MEAKYILGAIACICITVVSSVAVASGQDGAVIGGAMAGIAAIAAGTIGYAVAKKT